MSGKFIIDRDIFSNPIWQNPIEFRLFFFILGKAIWSEEGVRIGEITVKRGQYLRSYRNLRNDLMYLDNNAEKFYGITTIKRAVDKLIKDGRLEKEDTKHGTLFTVVNYKDYQRFERDNSKDNERSWNDGGTEVEQRWNNNKKDKKDKKDNINTLCETSPKFNEESIEYRLANYLYKHILKNDPKMKEPNLYKWAETMDYILRIDERDVELVKEIIRFATTDDFWMSNILSPKSLRKQFQKLAIKAKQKGGNHGRDRQGTKTTTETIEGQSIAERAGVTSL